MHVDVKSGFALPNQLRAFAAALGALIPPSVTCVAASGYGGIPLATAISLANGYGLTLIRERPKPYGAGAVIEGHLPTAADVIAIVDDKIVSGKTMANSIAGLRTTAAEIAGIYVVLDAREMNADPAVEALVTLESLEDGWR